jgi:hypothetical protein
MLTTRTPEGGATDMHVYMLQQLAADRVAELRADAQRARHQRVLRASKADRAACRAGPVNLAAALRLRCQKVTSLLRGLSSTSLA